MDSENYDIGEMGIGKMSEYASREAICIAQMEKMEKFCQIKKIFELYRSISSVQNGLSKKN